MALTLVRPTMDLFAAWAEALAEFGGADVHGMGMDASTAPDRASCAALVELAERFADPGAEIPADKVHADHFWMVDDGEVVGFIGLRWELNAYLAHVGGHIGYSVRPSRRRRGHAGAALRMVLDHARERGIGRVMLTCDDDNRGSARTIEGAGGVLGDVIDASDAGHPRLRRYWIEL
ncbi:GNAT family N-acetyltransferase [Leucobacter sp. HNU]|uniref:GNAT family N-acetyltransferase n=1 Tax=Leucobacter sp. HNU TaxID=3236805 RepID=UPI003A7FB67D